MQNENFAPGAHEVTCPSCRAALTAGLRFCRMCGFRLGEGVEEFNETRRFDGTIPTAARPAGLGGAARAADPFAAQAQWGAAPLRPVATCGAGLPGAAPDASGARSCRSFRMNWVGWMVLCLAIMFAIGGGVKLFGGGGQAGVAGNPPRVFFGVDGFETAEGGGAFIEGLDSPGGAAYKAGLIGGDVIKSFDGRPIADAGDIREAQRETPLGKAVEVVFVRDGQTQTTTLVTEGREGYEGLDPLRRRPGGLGRLEVSNFDRVRVPNSDIYGVRVGDVERNGPADLAGIKEGDIVVEFNGRPVRTEGDLTLRIYESAPGSTVGVGVVRDGQRIDIPVKVGRSRD
jgi:hypothetical protein